MVENRGSFPSLRVARFTRIKLTWQSYSSQQTLSHTHELSHMVAACALTNTELQLLQRAFASPKKALVQASGWANLGFPPPYKLFDVICDASGFGIRAVLIRLIGLLHTKGGK